MPQIESNRRINHGGVRRLRLTALWAAFACATVAAAVAIHHLYATVSQEIEDQSRRAVREERANAEVEIRTQTEALRHATIAKLAAFHVEGLEHSLQAWAAGDSTLSATFTVTAAGELHVTSSRSTSVVTGEVEPLWRSLRAWRSTHPTGVIRHREDVGPYRTEFVRMLDNPEFGPGDLGYQSENLSILEDSGAAADPWAGWAAKRNEGESWIFWYQGGPTSPIRGCIVRAAPVVARLRAAVARSRLALLSLVPAESLAPADPDTVALVDSLPGYVLVAHEGALFAEKQAGVRFAAAAVVLLIGVFLLGAGFLVVYSRREIVDAQRKATFVTQVSHELRTPLTSIQMFADLLAAPEITDDKRTKYAGRIGSESRRLAELIERLLTFSALEKGKATPVIAPVNVIEVIRESLEETSDRLAEVGLKIHSELPAHPVTAWSDRAILKQALLNLLDNARKYASAGEIVRMSVESTSQEVRIRVADAGPGIPASLGERVFEPFVQGDQTLTGKAPGVGLGLTIARGLLRHAGGDLLLVPSDTGAVFEIRLPVTPSS